MLVGFLYAPDGHIKRCSRCYSKRQQFNGDPLPCAECSGYKRYKYALPPEPISFTNFAEEAPTEGPILRIVELNRSKPEGAKFARWHGGWIELDEERYWIEQVDPD